MIQIILARLARLGACLTSSGRSNGPRAVRAESFIFICYLEPSNPFRFSESRFVGRPLESSNPEKRSYHIGTLRAF